MAPASPPVSLSLASLVREMFVPFLPDVAQGDSLLSLPWVFILYWPAKEGYLCGNKIRQAEKNYGTSFILFAAHEGQRESHS